MTRSTIRLFAWAVALGVLTTVAVAWCLAAFNRLGESDVVATGLTSREANGWSIAIASEPGARFYEGNASRIFTNPEILSSTPICNLPIPVRLFDDSGEGPVHRARNERGWPFLALASEAQGMSWPWEGYESVTGGIGLGRVRNPHWVDHNFMVLPLMPVWPGFVLDTLIYGAIWWCVIYVRRLTVRRRLRFGRRSIALLASASVTLGVITTVAVAWMCAALVEGDFGRAWWLENERQSGKTLPQHGRWEVWRGSDPGVLQLTSRIAGGEGIGGSGPGPPPAFEEGERWLPTWARWLDPEVAGAGFDPDTGRSRFAMRAIDARGWPFVSMHSREQYHWSPPEANHEYTFGHRSWGWTLPRASRIGDGDIVLPLLPTWPGFILDTVLFALMWAVLIWLLVLPGIVRRTTRHRRGRCQECGYDLRGDLARGCPECGWGRRDASRESSADAPPLPSQSPG